MPQKSTQQKNKMNTNIRHSIQQLIAYLDQFEEYAIAVSGGIDSMLLAYIANRFSIAKVHTVHAFSPAVPEAAFERVKQHAKRYKWTLTIVDAHEFDDPNYLSNPANRCYYCKSNLYARIATVGANVTFSGTNTDDLNDVRPGLVAAEEQHVLHPYVQVGINKAQIYAMAKHFGLDQLHVLPAQPCLASRVETGIKINPDDLLFINQVEEFARALLPDIKNVRCRITRQGTYLELDTLPNSAQLAPLSHRIGEMCAESRRLYSGIRTYQKGSAFINGIKHA